MILDPLPAGVASASSVRLYADPGYADEEKAIDAPLGLEGGRYVLDTLEVVPGRWWPKVTGLRTNGAPVTYRHRFLDLPLDDALVVSPEAVASAARIPLPLTPEDREFVTQQILAAQSAASAYLDRPLMPIEYVECDVWDDGSGEWHLTLHGPDEFVRVLAVDAESYDTYTVRYLAGINARDGARYEPIRQYVLAHAMNTPGFTEMWKRLTGAKGSIRSASTEGQTVSYEKATLGGGGAAGSGAPGSLPSLDSLATFRLWRVYQAPTRRGTRY